jgi:universal stress protein E
VQNLKNILVVVDPTAQSHPAVAKGAWLAHRAGAGVELFVCDYEASLSGRPFFDTDRLHRMRDQRIEDRRHQLEQLAAPLRQRGLDVGVAVAWDHPLHEGICRKVAESHPDLVVKDTHYHSILRRSLITNTDWHLIRSCPAPLLFTKPGEWREALRVVAAVDPGHTGDKPATLDREILSWGRFVAGSSGELHALHVHFPASLVAASVGVAGVPVVTTGDTADALVREEQEQRLAELRALVEPFALPPERIHLKLGAATDQLPDETERLRADLVVMGAVSRSRLKTVFIGSTAEQVLDRLPCDVLVVKPADFASDLPF